MQLLFLCLSALAQIYHCGETWTNQPCPGSEPIFNETISTPSPLTLLSEQKRDYLHQMISARYAAHDKFGVTLDSEPVERYCELEQTTLDQCRDRIDAFLTRLDSHVIEEQKLELHRREIELNEKKTIRQGGDSNYVVVIQNPYLGTVTPHTSRTAYHLDSHGNVKRPDQQGHIPVPSRNQVPNDARLPLPDYAR